MGRVRNLRVQYYRSIRDQIAIRFPERAPLVLMGENNSGKSNLVSALELVLGERWPGTHEPEDHEYYDRDDGYSPIEISVEVEEIEHIDNYGRILDVTHFIWRYPNDDHSPFLMLTKNGGSSPYVSNETRHKCLCIVVGADRRLAYQLSYSSKYTFLSRLMKQFHNALMKDQNRVDALRTKFGEIKAQFQEVEPFAAFSKELQAQVSELSGNFEYRLGVDFSAYDPSNFFHALRVHPQQGSETRTFEELGTGQEQILALSFAYAYARAFHGETGGLILVIEEPEAHLHPLAQRWVGQKIHELSKQGVQVIVTTHSPAFVNILNLEGLALIRKESGATKVIQTTPKQLAEYCEEHGASRVSEDTVLPFYAAAATEEILTGLFARKTVLVEGPTEALSLPELLKQVGLDVTREGIAIIPVHGVGNLAKWWRFFTSYGIPTYVIFDNDSGEDNNKARRRDLLNTLSIPSDDHERIMETKEWIVNQHFMVFGGDYEKIMRQYFEEYYVDLEQEALNQFGFTSGQSKHLVARYVAERLPHNQPHAGWRNSSCFQMRS